MWYLISFMLGCILGGLMTMFIISIVIGGNTEK